MQRHYLVIKSFVGPLGFQIRKGEIGIPGDSATPEVRADIDAHVKSGHLQVMGEGYRPRGWDTRKRPVNEEADDA